MGGLTSAVHWWEESQLRVLVLGSLVIQFVLYIFSLLRRCAIPGWFRSIMWLAYLGGDAVAIYALATLFNRHKAGVDSGGDSSSTLEAVWAPVLLIHLGGHDGITAYNIEDNELWSRHLITAVSQITVAIYVFSKSWPRGGDKRLLQAAILLFVPGVVKCLAKPRALKAASIHNLVSSHAAKQIESEIYTLEEYVKRAKAFVEEFVQEQKDEGDEAQGTRSSSVVENKDLHQRPMEEDGTMTREERTRNYLEQEERQREQLDHSEVCKLFVDLSSSYPRRLSILKRIWRVSEKRAYRSVREGLASAFLRLYTRLKSTGLFYTIFEGEMEEGQEGSVLLEFTFGLWMMMSRMLLPWASIGLFHHCHRETYNDIDVKITYALLCCTAYVETYSTITAFVLSMNNDDSDETNRVSEQWPEMVAQYSLIQFFVRNKKHSKKMWIARKLGSKDFLDQHWCMESCISSARITKLVLRYLKDVWKEKIQDVASYHMFNDHSSHWVLEHNHCSSQVPGSSIKRPFDESVLLWHMATDFCFFLSSFSDHKCVFAEGPIMTWLRKETKEARRRKMEAKNARGTSSFVENKSSRISSRCRQALTKCKAVQCRQISNYMMYLLFVNPEMLLPGTRRNLFKAAYGELKDILRQDKPSMFAAAYEEVKDILFLKDNNQNGYRRVITAFKEMKDILKDNKRNPLIWSRWKHAAPVKEKFLMERLISTMLDKPKQVSEQELKEGHTQQSKGGCNNKEKLIDGAWALAQRLLDNNKGDEKKMWEDIERVWVEMLCFSASRCRGYLHAKALGNGGEFLSYIWLLLFYMGMETFTDRLQRKEHASWGGNNGTAPTPPLVSKVSPDPSTSSTSEVSTSAALAPCQVHIELSQSTSEIHMAAQDMV